MKRLVIAIIIIGSTIGFYFFANKNPTNKREEESNWINVNWADKWMGIIFDDIDLQVFRVVGAYNSKEECRIKAAEFLKVDPLLPNGTKGIYYICGISCDEPKKIRHIGSLYCKEKIISK